MFGKKECKRCGEKINGKFAFCPSCGIPLNEKSKEDLGMLGENDFEEFSDDFSSSLFGKFGGKMINKMFESAVKMLEKEMQKEMRKKDIQPRTNFQLYINGKRVPLNNLPSVEQGIKKRKETKSVKLPYGVLKKFSKLPKQEPITHIRRFSDKIIYEIEMPGVKSEKEISMIKLENSIEVRGIGKNVAYQKIIPINLPVKDYNISKGKLVLELGLKE